MSDAAPDDARDQVEQLLLECLDLPEATRPEGLEALCTRHPEHASELRRRYSMLSELGFVDAPPALEPDTAFGDYRLLQRLGGGSMGVVYLAEQCSTRRRVALKVLRPELLHSERARARFRRELQAAARIEHEGICPIYDAGETDGRLYLAMRYLSGGSLAAAIAATRAAGSSSTVVLGDDTSDGRTDARVERERIERAAGIVEAVARALHAAHELGLVHRDVKPGNIMLDAEERPVLVDFGLVRDDDADTLTVSTDTLGTPAYMAPEQIEPRGRKIDRRTDVHALGAVLFECVTLQPPYAAANRDALYRQILAADPPDARRFNSHVPLDLAVVMHKALDKEPGRRYPTALALAEELRRFCAHEPVQARPAGASLRLRRWSQRNPLLAGALAAAFVCLGVGLAVSLSLLVSARRMLAGRQAGDVAALAMQTLDHDATLAMHYALAADALEPDNPTVWSALQATAAALHEQSVQTLLSPYCIDGPADGRYCVIGSDRTDNNKVWILEGDTTPRELATNAAGHDWVHRVVVSKDGSRILVLSVGNQREGGGLATVWRPDQVDAPVARLPHPGEVLCACVTAVGAILTGCKDGVARLWSADGALLHQLSGHTAAVYSCAASPDGQLLVTGGQDCTVRRWDARTGQQLGAPIAHGGWVVSVGFAPPVPGRLDRFFTATGYDGQRKWRDDPGFADDRARLFDRDGTLLAELGKHENRIVSARLSPDGRHLLTAGRGQALLFALHDDGSATQVADMPHDGRIYGTCFDAAGTRFATITFSGTVAVWDLAGHRLATLRGHRVCGTGCFFRGDRLVTTGLDDTVRTWSVGSRLVPSWQFTDLITARDARRGRQIVVAARGELHRIDRDTGRPVAAPIDTGLFNITCVDTSRDGACLAVGDGRLHLFDADGRRVRPPIQAHDRFVQSVQFSPVDDRLILTTGFDGSLRLWDRSAPAGDAAPPIADLVPSPVTPGVGWGWIPAQRGLPIWSADWSACGTWIAAGIADARQLVAVWRLQDLLEGKTQPLEKLRKPALPVRSLAFAPDGKSLVCATLTGFAWIWNWEEGTERKLPPLERDTTSAAVSPDGSVVAFGLMNGTVHVVGIDGSACFSLPEQGGRIQSLQFLDGGSRLLVAAGSGRVTEWIVDHAVLMQKILERPLPRLLTEAEQARLATVKGR